MRVEKSASQRPQVVGVVGQHDAGQERERPFVHHRQHRRPQAGDVAGIGEERLPAVGDEREEERPAGLVRATVVRHAKPRRVAGRWAPWISACYHSAGMAGRRRWAVPTLQSDRQGEATR